MERLVVRVRGRVQGVWFRASAREEANKLSLNGWVANRPDGSVELCVEGSRPKLERLWPGVIKVLLQPESIWSTPSGYQPPENSRNLRSIAKGIPLKSIGVEHEYSLWADP